MSPNGLSSKLVLPLKLIIVMPTNAKPRPTKKILESFSSFKNTVDTIAVKNGATDKIIATFDAKVYVKAMFSNKKYKVTPHNPAPMKYSSWLFLVILSFFEEKADKAKNPIENLINKISTGVRYCKRILVDTKVVPQTKIHINAKIWPLIIYLVITSLLSLANITANKGIWQQVIVIAK